MSNHSSTPMNEREAHRARYEALRAEGQDASAQALPPLTARNHKIPQDVVLHREHLPGGWYWTTRLARGEALPIVNTPATSPVSMLPWCHPDPSHRLTTSDPIKVHFITQ